MLSFLASLFFIALFIVLFILVIGVSLLSRFFGGLGNLWKAFTGRSFSHNSAKSQSSGNFNNNTSGSRTNDRNHSYGNPSSGGKIFGNDEGVYIDFEEVRD